MLSRRALLFGVPAAAAAATVAPALPDLETWVTSRTADRMAWSQWLGPIDDISIIYGRYLGAPVDLQEAYSLIYRVSDRPVKAVEAVYDGGVPLDIADDYPDLDALRAADLKLGTVATCKARGRIRLASLPAYEVTADVAGEDNFFDTRELRAMEDLEPERLGLLDEVLS